MFSWQVILFCWENQARSQLGQKLVSSILSGCEDLQLHPPDRVLCLWHLGADQWPGGSHGDLPWLVFSLCHRPDLPGGRELRPQVLDQGGGVDSYCHQACYDKYILIGDNILAFCVLFIFKHRFKIQSPEGYKNAKSSDLRTNLFNFSMGFSSW